MGSIAAEVIDRLRSGGVGRGGQVAVAITADGSAGMTAGDGLQWSFDDRQSGPVVAAVEEEIRPRWVVWSSESARLLVNAGVRVATCWDVASVHRLLVGGWRADPARVWAQVHGLKGGDDLPRSQPVDLFHQVDHQAATPAVRADGYLDPDWAEGCWADSPDRLVRWAGLALEVARRQGELLAGAAADAGPDAGPVAGADAGPGSRRRAATARSESAAELLCAELAADGLPMDRTTVEALIAASIGPRARTEAESVEHRAVRDAEVLQHAPAGMAFDLRSPIQVRQLLRSVGIEVPDTRASRLEPLRDAHPVVEALLGWRKAERIATTYGYAWLDEHLGADGRLRGEWTGCDGAAGRMTASAGLHNMPADLRPAVMAENGFVFVRADLGQIEPRVLAAVSDDQALARAAREDDMYAPVAAQLGVDRATAKVAVLGAMYGQTTGHGAQALRRLATAYPVAMGYLDAADRDAQFSIDLRTYGGRLIRMGMNNPEFTDREARSQAAARGRYGRNAVIQGAAAEFFKLWAVTVRARAAVFAAGIVLCLHDELLVHSPVEHGPAVAQLLGDCLQEAAYRWAPDTPVRFIADTSIINRWSDAK